MPERPAAFDTTLFRVTIRRVLLVAASFTLALFGWFLLDERDALSAQEKSSARSGAANSAAGSAATFERGTEVVAEVDGRPITRADLEKSVGAELAELERRQNELYRQALQQQIDELLLRQEAKRRGVALEHLVAAGEREQLLVELRRGAEVRILGDRLNLTAR